MTGFAFQHHELQHGRLHDASARVPGDDWQSVFFVSADPAKVSLARAVAGISSYIDMTPEQARAVAAELIAAADAVQHQGA